MVVGGGEEGDGGSRSARASPGASEGGSVASAGVFSLQSTEQVVWMGPGSWVSLIECMPVCSDVGGSGSMVRSGGGGGPQESGFTEATRLLTTEERRDSRSTASQCLLL